MSAPPTSGSEDPEAARARAAGWRTADLTWEREQEAGIAALDAGRISQAAHHFTRAGRIAAWRFSLGDPRRATSLANLAALDRIAGRERRALRRYARARRLWSHAHARIAWIEPARRARSSLFHMRMEAKHWDTYVANMRTRLARFAAETAEALEALAMAKPSPHRLAGRWRAEKPPVYDEMRKFLSAALLIAEPPAADQARRSTQKPQP